MTPTIGANIRYVLASGPNSGAARLGWITNIGPAGGVSITCLPDPANDRLCATESAYNVRYSETKEPGTWHWPSAVEPSRST